MLFSSLSVTNMTLLPFLRVVISSSIASASSSTSSWKMLRKKMETGVSRQFGNDPSSVSSSSSTNAIVLPDYLLAVQMPSEKEQPPFTATPNKQGARALTGDSVRQCSSPDEVYYNAEFGLRTYYSLQTCSKSEWDEVGALIDYHFDQFIAHNEILGPIAIVPIGPSCVGRRLGQDKESDTFSQMPQPQKDETNNISFENGRKLERPEDQKRRKLNLGYKWFGGGVCEYCNYDKWDDRRRLTNSNNSPITVVVRTDNYPKEIAFTIRKIDDTIVYSSPTYGYANQKYIQTIYLKAGETYRFKATDSYGDGWCCSNGQGYAEVYEGASTSNTTQLLNLNYNFGSAETFVFDAPLVSSMAYRTSAQACTGTTPYTTFDGTRCNSGECSSYSSSNASTACTTFVIDSAFPQIEHDVSNYISYYIQQAYHWNNTHCLQGSYPTVWVGLSPTTESGSKNYCR